MSKDIDAVISLLVERIDQNTREIAEKKRTVNSLCREAGKDQLYPEAELTGTAGSRVPSIRASQFYGKTPTVAAREYLELRNEAVPLDEILDALQRGGFDFSAQGWSEAARLKNLGISISKNSSIFHKLPNDTWGLLKWYPNVKPKKTAPKFEQVEEIPEDEISETEKAKAANGD
jgi:hypothetical protein